MIKPFRKNHILKIIENFQESNAPADLFLHHYFKSEKGIGSHDRKEIAQWFYHFIRWKGLVEKLFPKNLNLQLEWLEKTDPLSSFQEENLLTTAERLSFPPIYYNRLQNSFPNGSDCAEFCLTSNQSAPITIRINPAKTTRESMLHYFSQYYTVSPTSFSPFGITFEDRVNLFQTEAFQSGLFEMQDEASQLAALELKAKPKQAVLDFCAGSGGKTLAFAHQMEGQGQIYIHDVREKALSEAKKRFNRAGIQNFQLLTQNLKTWNQKKKKMDWVFVDAPCSGSGTLRRNPDQKWKYSDEMLQDLLLLQRKIFKEALTFLKPEGKIIYATCSVLEEENEKQIEFFCKNHGLILEKPPFSSKPIPNGMDGFFAATLAQSPQQL